MRPNFGPKTHPCLLDYRTEMKHSYTNVCKRTAFKNKNNTVYLVNYTGWISLYITMTTVCIWCNAMCVGFFSWKTFQNILWITRHRGQQCWCTGRYSSRPHGSSSRLLASWKVKESKPPQAISLFPPAKWKLNNYWPLVVISTFLKPWSYIGWLELEKMNTGFGHLTIFLIGEAKLREVMETVLPRVLPVDVNLKPFSVLEFSQVWATFNWKFWEFWRKHIYNLELCEPEIEDAKARHSEEKGKGHAKHQESHLEGFSHWVGQSSVPQKNLWGSLLSRRGKAVNPSNCVCVTPWHTLDWTSYKWRTGWISREFLCNEKDWSTCRGVSVRAGKETFLVPATINLAEGGYFIWLTLRKITLLKNTLTKNTLTNYKKYTFEK